jgi:REP element-mobilizing transposase RayT
LQKYISGIIDGQKQKLYAIYCMPDHTHILVSLKPHIAISDLVRDIKSCSTTFIKEKEFEKKFRWQEGFGAFSYSKSQAPKVVEYILNQPNHHKKKSFKEEYLELLKIFEIDYEDKYLFEFYD